MLFSVCVPDKFPLSEQQDGGWCKNRLHPHKWLWEKHNYSQGKLQSGYVNPVHYTLPVCLLIHPKYVSQRSELCERPVKHVFACVYRCCICVWVWVCLCACVCVVQLWVWILKQSQNLTNLPRWNYTCIILRRDVKFCISIWYDVLHISFFCYLACTLVCIFVCLVLKSSVVFCFVLFSDVFSQVKIYTMHCRAQQSFFFFFFAGPVGLVVNLYLPYHYFPSSWHNIYIYLLHWKVIYYQVDINKIKSEY